MQRVFGAPAQHCTNILRKSAGFMGNVCGFVVLFNALSVILFLKGIRKGEREEGEEALLNLLHMFQCVIQLSVLY